MSTSKRFALLLLPFSVRRRLAALQVRRFKGHQNTSRNYVRAAFGPSEQVVVSGSEDGHIFLWFEARARARAIDRVVGDLVRVDAGRSTLAICCRSSGRVALSIRSLSVCLSVSQRSLLATHSV